MMLQTAGLPFQIGIASRSAAVSLADVVRVTAALNVQITRDFAPIWGVSASVVAIPNPDAIDPGLWPIFIDDDIEADALGFHLTRHNQPYARVLTGRTWSLTASHECLELLADPTGNRLYPGRGIAAEGADFVDAPDAKVEYLVEICDPCQDQACAYLINDVLVGDFYTPNYFDPIAVASVRYSYSGQITRPRQILKNGYLSWLDPSGREFRQARLFDRPEIVRIPLPSQAEASLMPLRRVVDAKTPPSGSSRLPQGAPKLDELDRRENYMGIADVARASLYGAGRRPQARPAGRTRGEIAQVVTANQAILGTDGVMAARPGWRLSKGWVTNERAIVVIARPDVAASVAAKLPAAIDGIPLDVRPATPLQQLRHNNPALYAATASGSREEYALADYPGQITFGAAQPAEPANTALFAAARPQKTRLEYTRPDVSLDPVTEPMRLVLHASPDTGWVQLKQFLTEAPGDLVVGMYDFTSPHVEQALLQGRAGGRLTLTLDHPPGKSSREQTIDETRADLDPLGDRLAFAWALERNDPKVRDYVYPNAYHIKVAVRPDDTLWLSSGNWNTSNQPEIDLSDREAAQAIAQKSDRDWHVIARSPGLAKVFRAYLEEDNRLAVQHQAPDVGAVAAMAPETLPPELLALEASRPPPSASFFPVRVLEGTFKVRPLLTPFDYQPHILALIQGAQTRFWMQTQYIKPSGRPGDEDHDALIAALAARIAAGVDVRLIVSAFETADSIEMMQDAGVPASVVRIQPQVHNKGMLVDQRHVVVSSQNWSADGTLRNRDAGVIIYDAPEAAAYFEQIFLHDWAHLASQKLPHGQGGAADDGTAPA
ncbi:MAG: hypothetical protein NVSMB18_04810 [Acetobacteraceae bacterium]